MCVCRRVTAGQGRDHIASLCLVGWLVDVLCAGLPAAVDNAAVGSRITRKAAFCRGRLLLLRKRSSLLMKQGA